MFLDYLRQNTDRPIRAIGFNAIRENVRLPEGIEWIYGDIQRRHTWEPDGALQPNSVDVAVSNLTLMHLADPLSALDNITNILRPGGHLYADTLFMGIDGETASATLRTLQATFRNNWMSSELVEMDKLSDSRSSWLDLSPVFLKKNAELDLENIVAKFAGHEIVYGYEAT